MTPPIPGAMTRVLLLAAANLTSGGGERHVTDILRRLQPEFDLSLACPPGGDLGAVAVHLGIPVFSVPIAAGFGPAQVRSVRRAIRLVAPNIVHAHGSRAAAYARIADPEAARRVLYTVHGIHVDQAGTTARRAALLNVERILRHRTARFVTVCCADASKGARLGTLAASRTTTIYNGVEIRPASSPGGRFRAELGVPPGAPLVLSVGRFHAQKDQETLLLAWRLVTSHRPDAVLAIVGSGTLESRLSSVICAQGMSNSVRLVAPRETLADAYRDADVFALSSRWEGLPYVILEAMAHSLPVASTWVDGIPEAVADGSTGLLVPPGDPSALGQALVRLVSDPAQRARLGAAGRARVERDFSLGRMIDEVARLYRRQADVLRLLPGQVSGTSPSRPR